MVTIGPCVLVLSQRSRIFRQGGVLQGKWVLALFHGAETNLRCGLESLIRREFFLEVYHILCGGTKVRLITDETNINHEIRLNLTFS